MSRSNQVPTKTNELNCRGEMLPCEEHGCLVLAWFSASETRSVLSVALPRTTLRQLTDVREPLNAAMNFLRTPVLTARRMGVAIAVAIAADAIQFLLGPLGWVLFDQIIDLTAMILITLLIGFHPLLLPTFLVELIPIVDMLPTWTGCVALVLALRRKDQRPGPTPPPVIKPSSVIDV